VMVQERPRSQGELEAEITRVMIQFEKEYMGRGPVETRAFVLEDMILVRLRGVLTVAEQKLAARDEHRGRYLIKQMRQELLEHGRHHLEAVMGAICGIRVKSLLTDVSTRTGERVIVFILERRPEFAGASGGGGRPDGSG
jgi:uncharacterized protein YbcI